MRLRDLRWVGMLGITGAALLLGGTASAGIQEREARQRSRIHVGIEDGSLTPGEARRLGHEQRRIERAERRFRANDGHLGPRERVKLNRRLNRSNRHVYRGRHNPRGE